MSHPDPLASLNDEQKRAVLTTQGPLMVIAGPGSGKTRVIIQRIARLITQLSAAPSSIMAVTFTNKAAAELVRRLEDTVPPAAARAAQVSTFHRFCGQLNRRYGPTIGLNSEYTIYDHEDQLTVVRRAMEAAGFTPTNSGIRPGDVLSAISKAKSLLLGPEEYPQWLTDQRPPRRPRQFSRGPGLPPLPARAGHVQRPRLRRHHPALRAHPHRVTQGQGTRSTASTATSWSTSTRTRTTPSTSSPS